MIYTLGNGVTVDLNLSVVNSWNGGFITKITMKNVSSVPLTNWSLDLDLASGIDAAKVANSSWTQSGQTLDITPTGNWLKTVSPNEEISLTFRSVGNVSDLASEIVPTVITSNGVDYNLAGTPPPDGGINTEIVVKSAWANGAWVQFTLDNMDTTDLTNWQLPVTLPAGMTFVKSGALDFVDLGGGQYILSPKQSQFETLETGEKIAVGITLKGDPANIDQIIIGDPTGEQPPDAMNDVVTNYNYDGSNGEISFNVSEVLGNDGAGVSIVDVSKVAGGGVAFIANNKIFYASASDDAGRIVLEYEVAGSDGLTNTAQVAFDMPTPPTLNVGDITVDEDAGTAQFTVTLSGQLYNDTVEVDFQTRERSAKDGADFDGKSGTLNFTDASRTKVVTVDLVDNFAKEFDETFDLVLTNPRGARIEEHAGEATIVDDGDTGVLGTSTPGLAYNATLAGEFVVGYTATVSIVNTSGATLTENPIFTVGVEDGMKIVQRPGGLTEDGKALIRANHDDRYYTFEVDLTAPFLGPDLADGTFDAGDTLSLDLFFSGAHFQKPLSERIEINPATFNSDQPVRDFVPLNLTYKGFNTTFFNRADEDTQDFSESIDEVKAIGANSTAIVTTHFTDTKSSNTITATDFTMTDADLVDAIRAAKGQGLDVLLKPHLDVEDKTFRGRIDPQDEATFFGRQPDGSYAADSYGELIMRYAAIAETEGVDVFLIGTELVDLAKNRANLPFWTDLISDVRDVYSGDLSYASIVGEELFVRFWDQLDLISLDIYPPLTDNPNPSVGELIDGWTETPTNERSLEAYFNQPILDLLEGMSTQYGKKILITETGFRSVDGISTRPFDFNLQGDVDLQEQADAYEALFTSLEQGAGSFLDGIFLWEWGNQASATDGTVERPSGYELANKPALDLVDDFFTLG